MVVAGDIRLKCKVEFTKKQLSAKELFFKLYISKLYI